MEEELYPFEFVVPGTPLSLQAKNKAHLASWKGTVSEAARERRDEVHPGCFLDEAPLAVVIFYFAPALMEGDVDNIVKPILDALISVAYLNDRQVERVTAQKFEPGIDATFDTLTEKLGVALDAAPPVIYVRVEDDLHWRVVK